jgi:16S rRNA A1518/A1519 N6-dimethyltransferase RsmA/KsgA/DIM1 with predicted DNA glycosylase/AP lyase activity
MLRRSLTSVLDDPESTLSAAGIRPEQRAEELTPTDFLRLAEVSGG